jgi:hypothetical protein
MTYKHNIKYKNYKDVEIEYTDEDKKTFIESINFCNETFFGEIYFEVLVKVCPLQPEITWFFHQKWLEKN